MRDYEMVVVISPEVAEEDVPGTLEKVTQLVTTRGGEMLEVDHWGKRRLAYPINHLREGNYVLTRFKLEPKAVAELEASLRMAGEVLRHLVVRLGS
ncbi:30S ribosomal protein S6 [Chloroflexota bacterium]